MPRRCPPWVVLVAAALHVAGLARSSVPGQDGLKFLRVARQFQSEPWADVVRNSDQHPLYPALVAAAEPLVSSLLGRGPDAWRVAGQLVSVSASLLILIPIFGLTLALFRDRAIASMAALLWALLPVPAEVGRELLADPVALLAFAWALRLGLMAVESPATGPAIGCAVASGLGYLARPEVALLPVVVAAVAAIRHGARGVDPSLTTPPSPPASIVLRRCVAPVAFLAILGAYGLVKGEVSEKLALRSGLGLDSRHAADRARPHAMPRGLDGPGWDFSAKEEADRAEPTGLARAARRVGNAWVAAMGWGFVVFAGWGVARASGRPERWILVAYIAAFGAILTRHAAAMGYVSPRHTLSAVVASVPFAAAGVLVCGRRLASLSRLDARAARVAGWVVVAGMVGFSGAVQASKVPHDGRWGFAAAGRWLADHAGPGDAVLDTRGWARFLSGRPGYDYWHVGQALSDARLAYVVVGADELAAPSGRGRSLRALLGASGELAAGFPLREGGRSPGVLVYRFRRPVSWEGIRP